MARVSATPAESPERNAQTRRQPPNVTGTIKADVTANPVARYRANRGVQKTERNISRSVGSLMGWRR